ncbi:MAG TPA: HAD family phosphatase [Candidatus Tetragenococcus pullicola]|nr:HAD family phosphatase [Candidatus Tetragenococcus pullicola]
MKKTKSFFYFFVTLTVDVFYGSGTIEVRNLSDKGYKFMKQAVIFDVDGVIVFSERAYQKRRRRFFEQEGIVIDQKTNDLFVGSNAKDMLNYLVPDDDNKRSRLTQAYMDFQKTDTSIDYKKIFNPDIPETLEKLAKKGIRLAIASSGPLTHIEMILETNQIRDYFEQIISGEMFEHSKPNPEIYHHSVTKLGISPKECLVIEDSKIGIEAAVRADLEVAALKSHQFKIDQSEATYQIDSTKDILKLVK